MPCQVVYNLEHMVEKNSTPIWKLEIVANGISGSRSVFGWPKDEKGCDLMHELELEHFGNRLSIVNPTKDKSDQETRVYIQAREMESAIMAVPPEAGKTLEQNHYGTGFFVQRIQ